MFLNSFFFFMFQFNVEQVKRKISIFLICLKTLTVVTTLFSKRKTFYIPDVFNLGQIML